MRNTEDGGDGTSMMKLHSLQKPILEGHSLRLGGEVKRRETAGTREAMFPTCPLAVMSQTAHISGLSSHVRHVTASDWLHSHMSDVSDVTGGGPAGNTEAQAAGEVSTGCLLILPRSWPVQRIPTKDLLMY